MMGEVAVSIGERFGSDRRCWWWWRWDLFHLSLLLILLLLVCIVAFDLRRHGRVVRAAVAAAAFVLLLVLLPLGLRRCGRRWLRLRLLLDRCVDWLRRGGSRATIIVACRRLPLLELLKQSRLLHLGAFPRRRTTELVERQQDGISIVRKLNPHHPLILLARARPYHLALLAVHEAVAVIELIAWPNIVDLLADPEAARQRRWRRA